MIEGCLAVFMPSVDVGGCHSYISFLYGKIHKAYQEYTLNAFLILQEIE